MYDVTIAGDGVMLAGSVFGDDEAPPVLFLHGIGNARDTWAPWATRLADRYRVLTLDFRGHGHSGRADRYHIADYVADATAALAFLDRPTRVVGHSLGGVVAGRLAQLAPPLVSRTLLVDPAWFFGVPAEFARTIYPQRFVMLQAMIAQLRAAQAPLGAWVSAVAQTPHPWGGTFADHTPHELLRAHGSALHRQDPACWHPTVTEAFGQFDPLAPFRVPTTVLHADERFGAALLAEQADRLAAANPGAPMRFYEGSDHFPHRTHRFAERFGEELMGFCSEGL